MSRLEVGSMGLKSIHMKEELITEVTSAAVLNTLLCIIPGRPAIENRTVTQIVTLLQEDSHNLTNAQRKQLLEIQKVINSNGASYHCWSEIRISDTSWDMGFDSGTSGAVFTDGSGNITVSFRGAGDREWLDNCAAYSGYGKPFSTQQNRALKYFDTVAKTYNNGRGFTVSDHITVTGHCKGGNKAQFVTLNSIYGAFINKCYSLNGQGFSKWAVEKMKKRHGEKSFQIQQGKMYSICGENDYVNIMGVVKVIPQENTFYVKTPDARSFLDYHEVAYMLRNGQLGDNVKQGDIARLATSLISDINELPPDQQRQCVTTIMQLLEMIEGRAASLGGSTASFRDYIGLIAHGSPMILRDIQDSQEGQSLLWGMLSEGIASFYEEHGLWALVGAVTVAGIAIAIHGKAALHILTDTYLFLAYIDMLFDAIDAIKGKPDAAKALFDGMRSILTDYANELVNWYNTNFNAGYGYASANPDILVDTQKMRDYALRLDNVDDRIVNVDARLKSLYWRIVDIEDLMGSAQSLLKLIRADILTSYSPRLRQCANYLNEAAQGFETAERNVLSQAVEVSLEARHG